MTDTEIPDALDRARELVGDQWGQSLDRLAALDQQGWQTPTRLTGWTITDLVRHTVWGVSMEADALRLARTRAEGRADGVTPHQDASPAELLAALREGLAALRAELAELGPDDATTPVPMPYGDTPVRLVVDIYVMEAAVHAHDLAVALGGEAPLPVEAAEPTSNVLAAFLPVFASAGDARPVDGTSFLLRGDRVRLGGSWHDGTLDMLTPQQPTVVISGSDSAVLLFILGRLPVDDPQLTVTGGEELARALKSYIPGP